MTLEQWILALVGELAWPVCGLIAFALFCDAFRPDNWR